jgi:hypothetical protein
MKINLVVILSVLIVACMPNPVKKMPLWRNYQGRGLKSADEEFSKFIFLDESNILLLGTSDTYESTIGKQFDQQQAVVYKSSDSAQSWAERIIGKGRIEDGLYVDGIVYVLCNRSARGIYGKITSSTIFTSKDKGSTWDTVMTFPFFIRNIVFSDSLHGIVVCEDTTRHSTWNVLETIDGGKKWKSIFKENEISSFSSSSNSIYYLTSRKEMHMVKKVVVHFTLPFSSISVDTLSRSFEYRLSGIDDKGTLWLTGVDFDSNSIVITKNDQTGVLRTNVPETKGFFPFSMNIYRGTISIVAGKISGGMVSYKFYQTRDQGDHWDVEIPPISSYLKPIGYYHGSLWAYSGAGRMQYRK